MTVCFGPLTCAGTWDALPFIVLSSALLLTAAYYFGKKAYWGYLAIIVISLPWTWFIYWLGKSVIQFPYDLIFRTSQATLHDGIPFLLVIGTPILMWFSASWKKYGPKFLIVLWSVAIVLIIVFIILIRQEAAAERAAFIADKYMI